MQAVLNKIIHGDCLEVMPLLPDKSIDMILCDLPYGTTACKWDTVIPFEPLWEQYKRLIKPNGAIVLTASQPFTSLLIVSNIEMFKYCWVWEKNRPTGAQQSKNWPMRKHEDVVVFSSAPMGHVSLLGDKRMTYNPQGVTSAGKKTVKVGFFGRHIGPRPNQVGREYNAKTGLPHTILRFAKDGSHLHPTQKPVALFEYLIKTYTNEGEIVLDNCIGSGTTAIAALNTGRFFIGIEKDKHYYEIAVEKVNNHKVQLEISGG